ncbi:MAG: response regulator [Gammaproteobacteria bacterium]|nr:response regulator [Gammaproteobacteria bacterium]
MRKMLVHPYYFPTTTVFLDDDRDFLFNFSLQLDDNLSYHLFDSIHKAKQYIQQQARRAERQSFLKMTPEDMVGSTTPTVALNISDLHKALYNRRRFSEISVLVVDYAMPEKDGLTFCRQLNEPNIKKILLTGKASEQVAIQAFNEGLIHQYIQKGDPKVVARINQCIQDLQQAYFEENTRLFDHSAFDVLYEPSFSEFFRALCAEQKVVEYYLMNNPFGFLLVDENAQASFLLVQTERDLKVHYEIALEEKAPAPCLELLNAFKQIPYFWKTAGYYQKDLANEWQNYFYPATPLAGKQPYFCAMIPKFPAELLSKEVLSYSQYLDKLDFVLTE